jgi:hypothetical protein
VYPSNWPRCRCGAYTIDGKATCGDFRCGLAAQRLLMQELDQRRYELIEEDEADEELEQLVREVEER